MSGAVRYSNNKHVRHNGGLRSMFKRRGFGLCCIRHTRVRKPQRNGIQRVMKYRLRQAIATHRNHACPDYALISVMEPSVPATKLLMCQCRTTRVFKAVSWYHDRCLAVM